ncbi:MAG: hypothetical protein ABI885_24880 [Gammaproteobacteria bacterium]
MLEAVARSFEIDVATSKATCIDLLRANEYDVLVACERLSDGSGLELLSQVAQRWPDVIRVLSIERTRRALLRGRLGPFKLYETIRYPVDEYELEAVLERVVTGQQMGATRSSAPPAHPVTLPPPARSPQAQAPASRASAPPAKSPPRGPIPTAQPARAPAAAAPRAPASRGPSPGGSLAGNPASRGAPQSARSPQPGAALPRASAVPEMPPLPRRGSKIVPVGAPEQEFRILPHSQTDTDYVSRARREQNQQSQPAGNKVQEKAKVFAVSAVAAMSAAVNRYMKPQPGSKENGRGDSDSEAQDTKFTGLVQLPAKTPPYRKR